MRYPYKTSHARAGVRRGNTTVEYAIVMALIVVACIGTLTSVGRRTTQLFERVGQCFQGLSSTGQGPNSGVQVGR